MTKEELYKKAIYTYSSVMQEVVAMEELAELTKEITKQIRGIGDRDSLIEEMADVEIMLEQLQYIFDIKDEEIDIYKEMKLKRLERRLKE